MAIGFSELADWWKSLEDLEARSSECLSFARPRQKLSSPDFRPRDSFARNAGNFTGNPSDKMFVLDTVLEFNYTHFGQFALYI